MTDNNSTNYAPPAPQPPAKNPATKMIAVFGGVTIAIFALVVGASLGGGQSSGNNTPAATDVPRTYQQTPAVPAGNKYDSYYEHVLNNSGQANSMAKSTVIEFGDLVCQSLDNGYSIGQVVNVLDDASTTSSDIELSASVMYGAITYICPEYSDALAAYLGN